MLYLSYNGMISQFKMSDEMNWIGLALVLMGVVYLIYSVLCRDKVTYYIRKYTRINEITLIKPSKFFRLQLKFLILNSVYLIISGILIIIFNFSSIFIILGLTVFHLINFLIIVEGKKKEYIYYE